ncbi:AMP-binding enzyme family protein [Mycobacterium kansasii 732]|nr:AMP-binding enzyme family protein [Mycobacterium kansasii 732]
MTTNERPATMCQAFQRTAAVDPDAVALRTPGGAQTLTWREYAVQVRHVAAGLAGLGVGRGDTVSLMMANRIEFYPLEVGSQHVGATSFSVYNTLPAEQLTYVFDNAGTKVVLCEEQYVDRIRASGVPIDHIVCIDGAPEGTISVAELYAAAPVDFDFEAAWRAVRPDDVVTLIYTSGTTGNPKGVEMTHTNLLFEGYAIDEVLGIEFGDRVTSFLPSAHIADRMTGLYLQEMFGTQVTVVSDGRAIAAALPDVRPTVWARCPGYGKSSRPESNSRSATRATRRSGRHCSGRCRWPPDAPKRCSPVCRSPMSWPPNGPGPTSWCCRSFASGSASVSFGGRSPEPRPSPRRRWVSLPASASRSPRFGECPS